MSLKMPPNQKIHHNFSWEILYGISRNGEVAVSRRRHGNLNWYVVSRSSWRPGHGMEEYVLVPSLGLFILGVPVGYWAARNLWGGSVKPDPAQPEADRRRNEAEWLCWDLFNAFERHGGVNLHGQ